jgi:CDP-6-deoxy-D-xylo-4-hexulose-3-dehydrase
MAGLRVRLVDVDPKTLQIDPSSFLPGEQTRAISVVHLMGLAAPMKEIADVAESYGLIVLEDCCEALGADVGEHGMASAWSFFFSHQMCTMEGGAITTDSGELDHLLRLLRSHGWNEDHTQFLNWGFNVRPTEVSAVLGRHHLQTMAEANTRRWYNYRRFAEALSGSLVHVPLSDNMSPFGVPMLCMDMRARNHLRNALEASGVQTRPVIAGNILRHPAARMHGLSGNCPGADYVHDCGLSIGLHPIEEDDEIDRVIDVVRRNT